MNWADLEAPLKPEPLFYIEPQDRGVRSEHERQCELVKKGRARGWKVTATPNARAWGPKAWNRARAEGVEWGAADLTVSDDGPLCAYLEMKNGREMPEDHQVEWLNARVKQGFPCAVFRTADAAIAWLVERGFR